ncbi:hypothetical protein [Asticcacaulis sp.]|uniref:hypothetical protein n=1 Tax=Asticcacaulis sp. TaxID=1872648 RepID=UPI003F7C9670
MGHLIRAIIVAVIALSPATAHARLTETVKVRYETSEGASKWYEVDANFLTGMELNEATTSTRYKALKSYAEQPSFLICGYKFVSSCMPTFGRIKGPDQEGRQWEICTGDFCY